MKKLLLLNAILISFNLAFAQDSTLTIGIRQVPPFVDFTTQGKAKGLSVEFWQLVQRDLGTAYTFKRYESIPEVLDAVESGAVDFSINPVTVTDERMKRLSFSQPFYISGTAMVRRYENNWLAMIKNFFSWNFFSAVGILLLVILIVGAIIWQLEKKKNAEQFGEGLKGLGDGFWWSAVTMTTVGYGDKAPLTRAGRVVGFIWMFAAILIISSLTAGIASALTVQSLESNIKSAEDLRRFKTGTIAESSSAAYLELFNVQPASYTSVEEGLQAVADGELDVFVYDRPILQHYLNEGDFSDLILAPKNLKTDYYSFSFAKGNKLRDALDPLIVRALKSEQWSYKLKSIEAED